MRKSRLAVNCSILLKDRPIPERLDAVREAGIDAVEFWWPFSSASPGDAEVDAFVRAVQDSGLQLVGLNLFAGDMAAGDRGIVSWPGREDELRANLAVVAEIGAALNCRAFNALYGNRQPGIPDAEQDAVAVRNLSVAASELARIGGMVLLEPVSGVEAYPLKRADHVVEVMDRVAIETGAGNVALLLDMYHLAVNGDDVPGVLQRHGPRIAHAQIADAPGRGAPGTGQLPIGAWVDELLASEYTGWIALEYTDNTAEPFGWIDDEGTHE